MSGRSFTVQDQLAQLTAEVIVESLAMQDRDRELRRRAEANAVRNFSYLHRAPEAAPRNDRFYYIEDADVSFLDLNDAAPAPAPEPEPEPIEAKAVVEVDSNASQATIKADPTFIEKMKKVFITTPKKLLCQAVTPGSRDSLAAVTTPLRRPRAPSARRVKIASAALSPGVPSLLSCEKLDDPVGNLSFSSCSCKALHTVEVLILSLF
ncbi:hypothetical protein N7528_005494 [Penicillium herquei]|nr:hypothetical protein N7528_005494 [Penicillium herquei]